jgi:hypothetical protein
MALAVAGESDLGKRRRLSAWLFSRLFWHCNQPEHVGARTPYSDQRLRTYAAQKCLILANGASLRRDFIGCTTGAPSKHVHLALSNRASGNSSRCAMRSTVSSTNPSPRRQALEQHLVRRQRLCGSVSRCTQFARLRSRPIRIEPVLSRIAQAAARKQ